MPWAGPGLPAAGKGHPQPSRPSRGPCKAHSVGMGTGPCGLKSEPRCPAGAWQRSSTKGSQPRAGIWEGKPSPWPPREQPPRRRPVQGPPAHLLGSPSSAKPTAVLRGPQVLSGNLAMKQLPLCNTEPLTARTQPADPSSALPAPAGPRPEVSEKRPASGASSPETTADSPLNHRPALPAPMAPPSPQVAAQVRGPINLSSDPERKPRAGQEGGRWPWGTSSCGL